MKYVIKFGVRTLYFMYSVWGLMKFPADLSLVPCNTHICLAFSKLDVPLKFLIKKFKFAIRIISFFSLFYRRTIISGYCEMINCLYLYIYSIYYKRSLYVSLDLRFSEGLNYNAFFSATASALLSVTRKKLACPPFDNHAPPMQPIGISFHSY